MLLNDATTNLIRKAKALIKAEDDLKMSRYLSQNFKEAKTAALRELREAIKKIESINESKQKELFDAK